MKKFPSGQPVEQIDAQKFITNLMKIVEQKHQIKISYTARGKNGEGEVICSSGTSS